MPYHISPTRLKDFIMGNYPEFGLKIAHRGNTGSHRRRKGKVNRKEDRTCRHPLRLQQSGKDLCQEKEILSKLDQGEEPENLSLYSLASDYKIAMFDYDVLCARDKEYLSFVLKEEDYNTYNENLILSILKKYVDYEYGEIYSVSRAELPLLYAETRDKRNLDTYECIKKIS